VTDAVTMFKVFTMQTEEEENGKSAFPPYRFTIFPQLSSETQKLVECQPYFFLLVIYLRIL
jgi:hypothetical protein